MIRTTLALAPLMALALTTPATAAPEDLTPDQAMKSLDACLSTGAPGAPRTDLRAAIVALRALCLPQIHRVQDFRVAAATAGLSGEAAETAKDRAIRKLNDEIAIAVANYTGLTL